MPFTGLDYPYCVAVDAARNVYVTDNMNHRVVKLEAATNTQTVLPFGDLYPWGVAVDNAGSAYVASGERVLKLSAGGTAPTTLPFTGLSQAEGVAVDNAGNVYVASRINSRVLKLPAG